jgi:hypothetical protein
MINIECTNPMAVEAVSVIVSKIDKRLAISDEDKQSVATYLLAHRHKDSITIHGHQKLMDALLDAEVVGRAKGKTNYFLKPTYKELPQLTFQSQQDGSLHCYPVSKSGLWAKSLPVALTMNWDEIGGLGYGAAYYINPVDFAGTVAGFRDNIRPSVSFQSCSYPPDEEEAQKFTKSLLVEAWKSGVALAPIGDGFVCSHPDIALRHFNTHAVRTYNRALLAFSVITRDKYGRTAQSWGQW